MARSALDQVSSSFAGFTAMDLSHEALTKLHAQAKSCQEQPQMLEIQIVKNFACRGCKHLQRSNHKTELLLCFSRGCENRSPALL